MIGHLNAWSQNLPQRYGWRYRSAEAFKAEFKEITSTATDAFPANALYWRDQFGNWEAYTLMNTWRVIDLARSCVWALAREDAVCASLLARSALETAAAFVDAARKVSGVAEGHRGTILDPAIDLRTTIVTSEELEAYSLKTIFASRLPESETIYNPTNIVTIITRISKTRDQNFVLPTYGILCEAAHPNMLGRALYVHGFEPGQWPGNELRTLGSGNRPAPHFLTASIVAALSWACATQVSASRLMSKTIGAAVARLEAMEGKLDPTSG